MEVYKNKSVENIKGGVWKIIEKFPNYSVSNFGRIKSLKKNKIISQRLNRDGYCVLKLSNDFCQKSFSVHRLVAIAFIPNTENKETVNHKNGNRSDNSSENLEWNTRQENNNSRDFFRRIKKTLLIIDRHTGEILYELDLKNVIFKKVYTKTIKIT